MNGHDDDEVDVGIGPIHTRLDEFGVRVDCQCEIGYDHLDEEFVPW